MQEKYGIQKTKSFGMKKAKVYSKPLAKGIPKANPKKIK